MYSVNGIPLTNPALGWRLREPTERLPALASLSTSFRMSGRDGVIKADARDTDAPVLKLVIATPIAKLQALYALVLPGGELTLTADPTREARFEHLSTVVKEYGPSGARIADVSFLIRLVDAAWRDADDATSASTTINAASVIANVMSGISAPVRDATIRVKGPVSGLRVGDAGGSWFTYAPSIPLGTAILFTDGFARLTTAVDTDWTSFTTDVSGVVDYNGPRQEFELTPSFTTDPDVRTAKLTVTTATRGTGAAILVRGKRAYVA